MNDVVLMAEKVTDCSHTPAPWTYRDEQDREEVWIGVPGQTVGMKVIATVEYGFTPPANLEQKANARLIAAAPELLAALRACADRMAIAAAHGGRLAIDEPALIAAVEAIAKAEGQS